MSILMKPELRCNLQCKYCYEKDTRRQVDIGVDVDAVIKTAGEVYETEGSGDSFCLHGGEPTLLPKTEFEKILKFSFDKSGRSSIQTNGTLINDDHIRMFKQYKTGVGVSIDGRWPLNELRWAGSEKKTKETTEKTISNIYQLIESGLTPGLIVVLSKANATKERLPLLKDFLQEMFNAGINSLRLNLVISNEWGLSSEEAKEAYLELCQYTLENTKRMYQPFRDMVDNLLGLGMGTCVFTKCDFYHTHAGKAIIGDGSRTCCLKTAGNDRPFLWDPQYTDIRYQVLQSIIREDGGCGGCRYWRVCYGFCPSETPGGDWRNRAIYCEAYYACFEHIEKSLKGIMPNVTLVTDTNPKDEEKDYVERKGNRWSVDPFRAMSKDVHNPSTWKRCENQCVTEKQEIQEQRGKRNAKPVPGKPGYYHADHADQGGNKQYGAC